MTLKKAYELLVKAPCGDEPSRLNPNLTQKQAVEIVRNAVATMGRPRDNPCCPDEFIDPIAEKRVLQVFANRRRPRQCCCESDSTTHA